MKTDNQVIAEFMGWVHSVKDYHGINLFHLPEGDKIPIHCKSQSLEGFKYDTSWDWLMPVVEKIEEFRHTTDYPPEMRLLWIELSSAILEVNLSRSHRGVVEFIKWLNTNNK
jgi:hypothetical protein